MIVRTGPFPAIFFLTLVGLVAHGMIRLLFPAMTHVAASSTFASTKIIVNHLFSFPVDAWNGFVRINRRVSSVVLPVVSIHTFVFFVFSEVKNAKFSLVVKHVKVFVFDVIVDQFGLEFLFAMGVGTKLFVRAF